MARPRTLKPRKAVYKRYSKGTQILFVRKNTLEDVFDTARFGYHVRYRRWKSLGQVLKMTHEHQAKRKAIRMLRRMIELMMEDLLDLDCFIFPEQGFGYMRIGNLRGHFDLKGCDYDILYDGAIYGGMCVLHPLTIRSIGGRRYNLSLTRKHMKKLRDLRAEGLKYA